MCGEDKQARGIRRDKRRRTNHVIHVELEFIY